MQLNCENWITSVPQRAMETKKQVLIYWIWNCFRSQNPRVHIFPLMIIQWWVDKEFGNWNESQWMQRPLQFCHDTFWSLSTDQQQGISWISMKFLVLKVSCENFLKCLFLFILFLLYINVFLYLFKDKILREKEKFYSEIWPRGTNTGKTTRERPD